MAKKSSEPVHCWLVWRKAHEAASDYLYKGIEETDISDTDFRVLEALLNKGPLPVNTSGPKVQTNVVEGPEPIDVNGNLGLLSHRDLKVCACKPRAVARKRKDVRIS